MIDKIWIESEDDRNYSRLPEERKEKYRYIYQKATCCSERYILSVDVSNPETKDQSCVIKYNYEEYLQGRLVVSSVDYF